MKFYTILSFEKWILPTLQGDNPQIHDYPHEHASRLAKSWVVAAPVEIKVKNILKLQST